MPPPMVYDPVSGHYVPITTTAQGQAFLAHMSAMSDHSGSAPFFGIPQAAMPPAQQVCFFWQGFSFVQMFRYTHFFFRIHTG